MVALTIVAQEHDANICGREISRVSIHWTSHYQMRVLTYHFQTQSVNGLRIDIS